MSGYYAGKPIEERLFGRCIPNEDGCWIWQGGVDSSGYGSLSFDGRTIGAHRLAYLLYHGEIPVDQEVLHTCDTPRCCNPSHMISGTHQENMADCEAKGRLYKGGARSLSIQDVRAIRGAYDAGGSPTELAALYDVTPSTICKIGLRQTWRTI